MLSNVYTIATEHQLPSNSPPEDAAVPIPAAPLARIPTPLDRVILGLIEAAEKLGDPAQADAFLASLHSGEFETGQLSPSLPEEPTG